jgi:ribose transport system permease protein
MNPAIKWIGRLSANFGPLLALLLILIFFSVADYFYGSGSFLSLNNCKRLSHSASLIAIPALGMTMIIIAGGIDLSAGTALTLCATVLAVMLKNQSPAINEDGFALAIGLALLATIGTGLGCGLLNGLLISATQVVPFIVTLGSMSIFLGIGQILSGSSTVTPSVDHLPIWIQNLSFTGPHADQYLIIPFVPTTAIMAVVLGVVAAIFLKFTIFGRNLFALGSNRATARLCGVPIALTTVLVYTLAGLFFAIGGLLYFSQVKLSNPTSGIGKELEIIAAVVLGGGSLSGGRGSILGTLVGAIIIVVIRNGCVMLGIPPTYTHIIIGVIIIVAVVVDQLRNGSPEWLFRRLPQTNSDNA